MNVLFLCRSLRIGGAERQLTLLAKEMKSQGHNISVAVFYAGGDFEPTLTSVGVPVFNLNKQGRWDIGRFFLRLLRLVRAERPAIIHAYMIMPNILSVMLKIFVRDIRVVWGLRSSMTDAGRPDIPWRLAHHIERLLSRFADLVICNSHAGKAYAKRNGFTMDKLVVIPNGIDTEHFKPDAEARLRVRSDWGVADDETLFGMVARLDPVKDHANFLRAAAELAGSNSNFRFVCVGGGPESRKEELHALALELNLSGKLTWSDARGDMPAVYNAFDATVAPSLSEGFSNVIGEAMACGVPCVVTDVGDSARIVGDAGVVVPPSDAHVLSEGMKVVMHQGTNRGGQRQRICEYFNLQRVLHETCTAISRTAGM